MMMSVFFDPCAPAGLVGAGYSAHFLPQLVIVNDASDAEALREGNISLTACGKALLNLIGLFDINEIFRGPDGDFRTVPDSALTAGFGGASEVADVLGQQVGIEPVEHRIKPHGIVGNERAD